MSDKLDLREQGGPRAGQPQFSDRRLFLQLLAFGGSRATPDLIRALDAWQVEGALYEDIHDPQGVALVTWSTDPAFFTTTLRTHLQEPPFADLDLKPEFAMMGRSYAIGHEPDLDDWLLDKPRRSVTAAEATWGVWYPLRRTGSFHALQPAEQTAILREHGAIGHAFGTAGYAEDVRLACFGLDRNDNDFVIGLVGPELAPLSACVQAMRKTRQTSAFIQQMGPFFIGRAVWQKLLAPKL